MCVGSNTCRCPASSSAACISKRTVHVLFQIGNFGACSKNTRTIRDFRVNSRSLSDQIHFERLVRSQPMLSFPSQKSSLATNIRNRLLACPDEVTLAPGKRADARMCRAVWRSLFFDSVANCHRLMFRRNLSQRHVVCV